MKEPCNFKGCPSHAQFGVKVNIPVKGLSTETHGAIALFIGFKLCARHIETEGQVFLRDNPQIGELVTAACRGMGKADPDMTRAWLTGARLDSQEWLQYERLSGMAKP